MKIEEIESRINPRVLNAQNSNGLLFHEMHQIGCTPEGIKIMAPKGELVSIKLHNLTRLECNILKQGMLSVGADVAVHKDVVTELKQRSDAIIIATNYQYNLAIPRLLTQPWKIPYISMAIKKVLDNYSKKIFKLKYPGGEFTLGKEALVMGILNVTPDSFYDGGKYFDHKTAIEHGIKMLEEKVDIIDIGGESTRPGSAPVRAKTELERILAVIKTLAKNKAVISVDTYKHNVASAAIDNGAVIINSVFGVSNGMAKVASRNKTPIVINHIKGKPKNMQDNPVYNDVISEISQYFRKQSQYCLNNGIGLERIILDPGIGFGKNHIHNAIILKRLSEFRSLGHPIMIGTSRKRFIGDILNIPKEERLNGTLASISLVVLNGANIVRVHDVKPAKQVVKLLSEISNRN